MIYFNVFNDVMGSRKMKRIAMVAVTSLLAGCSNLNGSLEGALGGDPDPQSGQQGQQIEVVEMGE